MNKFSPILVLAIMETPAVDLWGYPIEVGKARKALHALLLCSINPCVTATSVLCTHIVPPRHGLSIELSRCHNNRLSWSVLTPSHTLSNTIAAQHAPSTYIPGIYFTVTEASTCKGVRTVNYTYSLSRYLMPMMPTCPGLLVTALHDHALGADQMGLKWSVVCCVFEEWQEFRIPQTSHLRQLSEKRSSLSHAICIITFALPLSM